MTVCGTELSMSEQQRKAILESLKRMSDRAKTDPDYAMDVLVKEGVYTKDGEVGENYR
ncbi:hypothetical protein SAMN02982917_1284 [Azospirillum oryzae]|uniref:Uncharacterized protein n=1 Tax=Azospirillum oryzae TaxID=286727 RepID=A0A1X7E7K2_9PROT|nr:hypothetical protein SAMN02982917_1284 [Azospirillum oryzae]